MKQNTKTGEKLPGFQEIDKLIHEPARLAIVAYLSVLESADALFLQHQTGLTWGNLSSHLSKLEEAGYIEVTKEFIEKKPHTALKLTEKGRIAFREYRDRMKNLFEKVPS
jgi:DNA-binding transcriptional ArsR family regulator